ncbi:leukocyte immunoglobulin-like receptor subfamily A member 5 isoform X1 [Vombatus ursinus]|uniref:Ig-like domain-containing protein n=2 Tax=Vombatus ursinus TaxID=29139 RepID=A0A4X2L356_VOMUR|nr:leukocyte immunoglobulin-like receptor subfamily A member 5 isoform X1 [Vombatus ursinus]
MGPAGTALLCLGLCMGQGIKAQAETFLRPTLKADSGPLIPKGTPVILRCKGHPGATWYYLMMGETQSQGAVGAGMEANFLIPSMTKDTAGSYHCLYKTQSGISEPSEPLELVMTGFYDKPSLLVLSIQKVVEGQRVILSCHSEQLFDRFTFYEEKGVNTSRLQKVLFGTNITSASMTTTKEGTYRCYSFHSRYPYLWSASSDPVEVRVSASPSPPDATPQDYTVSNLICLSLAGLVLIILGVLLVEAWYSWRALLA